VTNRTRADEYGFVFAQFGFAGDEHGAVVHVGRSAFVRLRGGKHGVAGEEFEIGVAVAPAVDVGAFVVGEVEVYFDHAAAFVFAAELPRGVSIRTMNTRTHSVTADGVTTVRDVNWGVEVHSTIAAGS
jgi:hypothetical protein